MATLKEPRFSIIVPAYNVAEHLKHSLMSVCSQTYDSWECVCVDDGSSDETGSELEKWSERDSRIRVMHKENGGVASARNLAIENADGQYLVFLDSDDALAPYALKYLATIIDQYDCPDGLTYCFEHVLSHGNPWCEKSTHIVETRYNLVSVADLKEVLRRQLGSVLACNSCWRREVIRNIKFESIPNGEDVLWGAHCMMRAKTMVCSSAKIYRYLSRPESAVNTISIEHVISAITCVRRMVESMLQWDRKSEVAGVLFSRMLSQVLGYTRGVLAKLPPREQRELREDFCSVLSLLCRDCNFLTGWKRIYFDIAASNFATRFFMLYIPFDLYAKCAKRCTVK